MNNSKSKYKKKKSLVVYSLVDSLDDDMAIGDSIPLMSHQEYSNFDQDDYLSEGGRKQGYGMYSSNKSDRKAESFCNRCCWCINKACSNFSNLCCGALNRIFLGRKEFEAKRVLVGENTGRSSPPNIIRNQKYSFLSFVPLVLFHQFKIFLNLYFLCVAITQFIPSLRVGPLYAYWAPLV